MGDLWDYFKKLFFKTESSSPSNPLIHEMISRTEAEKKDYRHWKETLVRRRLQDWLSDQYALYRVTPDDIDEAIDFLDTPSSKGFVIYLHLTQYSLRDSIFFLDFLKDRVLKINYKVQISDTRTYSNGEQIETVQRHYLKPRPNFETEGRLKQQFGNVTIELLLRDEKPYNLKFRATSYRDSLFEDPQDFKDLIIQLVS